MKVSDQPVSAFAIYSEKLKQKKKKGKPQISNGVSKHKKLEKSKVLNKFKTSAEQKTVQMKEIGYILQKLTERSVDKSSPRGTALLSSINDANEKLEHDDNVFLEDIFKDLIVIGDLKRKAKTLKDLSKKKSNENVIKSVQMGDYTDHSTVEMTSTIDNVTDGSNNCRNFVRSMKTVPSSDGESKTKNKLRRTKLENKKESSNGEGAGSNLKEGHSKHNNLKLTKKQKLKKNTSNQLNVTSKKREKGKLESSDTTAKQLFEWLIIPVLEKDFMHDFWEKKPLLIQREGNRNYFSELLSTEIIDKMLRENNVCFTKHLDVTSYTDGVRETHNLTGRAQANVVWDFYSNGCSVRLLNPQIFLPKIHALNATLQEYFGCFVGANVYLTPPNSQGFAPHYDDIEAFVLQIEGKKQWKVYTPRTDAEVLPRFSSPNFSQDEIGEPFLDVTLEPGDLLYFPRGFIHQASTVEGEHSLHITLSAYQKTAWVDLFEKVLPIALKKAAEDDVEFRRGLPRDYLGLEYRGGPREKRSFMDTAQSLMAKLGHYLQISLGFGVDQMGAQFMHDALPPVLLPSEKQNSSVGGGLKLKNGNLDGRVEFQMDTCVKLIRSNICRLVEEENEVRLYHCLDNPLEYHGEDPQFLVLPPEGVQVITHLQTSYPRFIPISDIPHEDEEELITLISDLWDAGLISARDLPVVEES